MRIFVSGPMTGLPDYNRPAFNAAAQAWREAGWEVVNPAEHKCESYPEYIRLALRRLIGRCFDMNCDRWTDHSRLICGQQHDGCDAIATLRGSWNSAGARSELGVAQLLDLLIFDADDVQPPPEGKLTEGESDARTES